MSFGATAPLLGCFSSPRYTLSLKIAELSTSGRNLSTEINKLSTGFSMELVMEASFSLQQILYGVILAVVIALLARWAGALAASGAWAASVIGFFIFGFGGLPWAALLLTFFISSSALSKLFTARKKQLSEKFAKGSRRDWGQVLANGGVGAFLAVIQPLQPEALWPWLAFAGAMATVNADTWATELGVLSPKRPRLITTGQKVDRGTSGGVSITGSVATLAGALVVALVGKIFTPELSWLVAAGGVSLAGFAGAFLDSLLGATVQAIYYDPSRQKETERRIFMENGQPARPVRGWEWMNNDVVNFLSSIFGAAVSVGFYLLVV
jgi:uncharacterized protein (TIGR00297 family)